MWGHTVFLRTFLALPRASFGRSFWSQPYSKPIATKASEPPESAITLVCCWHESITEHFGNRLFVNRVVSRRSGRQCIAECLACGCTPITYTLMSTASILLATCCAMRRGARTRCMSNSIKRVWPASFYVFFREYSLHMVSFTMLTFQERRPDILYTTVTREIRVLLDQVGQ